MRPGFHEWMVMVAQTVSLRSPDPSTQCGCVIVRPDKSIAATGYNGFPRRMHDRSDWWSNRTEKYDRVIHAEMNALLHAHENVAGYTMYINTPPCKDCAKHIAAAGIKAVYYCKHHHLRGWKADTDRALKILADSEVEVHEIESNTEADDGRRPAGSEHSKSELPEADEQVS